MQKIVIDEPLILIAACQWVRKKKIAITSLSYYKQPQFRPFRTLSTSTYFILLGLFHAFVRSYRLTELIKFPRVSIWAHHKAQLIKLHKLSGNRMKWSYQSYVSGTSTRLVWASEGPHDTKHWFDSFGNEGTPPFCVHNSLTSPTIIFPLQLADNTAIWIALKVLMDPTGDVGEAFRQMHPDHLPDACRFFFIIIEPNISNSCLRVEATLLQNMYVQPRRIFLS